MADQVKIKRIARQRKHSRIRTKVFGTDARPRVCVYRSLKHIYAQAINDQTGLTLVSCSTMDPDVRAQITYGGNIAAAKIAGKVLGERLKEKGIKQAVFDRGGFKYHGRIKQLADAIRESGIDF